MRSAALLAAMIVTASSGVAAPLTIDVNVRNGGPTTASDIRINLHSSSGDHDDVAGILRAGEWQTTVDVPAGAWQVFAASDDFFVESRTAIVGTQPESIALDAWALGDVRTKVSYDGPPPAHERVKVQWPETERGREQGGIPAGEMTCAIGDHGNVVCRAPIGELDLRIRSDGYLSHLYASQKISGSKPLDLGTLTFHRGAAVVGRVIASGNVSQKEPVVVELFTNTDTSRARLVTTATPNAKGYFAVEGIEPGLYAVRARAGHNESERRAVGVRANSESELLTPLLIDSPVRLQVHVTPSVDEAGHPWRISLDAELNPMFPEAMGEREAQPDGALTFAVPPGNYRVSVMRSTRGHALAVTRVVLKPGDVTVPLPIALNLVAVRGTVKYDHRPLAAELSFGGRTARVATAVRSGDDGTYSAVVPLDPQQTWTIAIDAAGEGIHTRITARPSKSVDGNVYDLDLDIAAGTIHGSVVETDGSVVANAIVTIDERGGNAAETTQVRTGADGAFVLRGLAAGDYALQAEGSHGRRTEAATVRVDDAVDNPAIVLRVRGQRVATFRVVGAGGAPIGGARVFAIAEGDRAPVHIPCVTNDAGECRQSVDADVEDASIYVIARGFPFKAFRAPMKDGVLNVLMTQDGGALRVELPAGSISETAPPPLLSHRGTVLSLYFYMGQGLAKASANDRTITIDLPLLEAGDYALCDVPAAASLPSRACSAVTLAPYSTATLRPH
jgi:hypothetical protein